LLDHLRTTESFKFDGLRWLILDEADRYATLSNLIVMLLFDHFLTIQTQSK
jgi:superfamily II DNA/RNA helicase